MLANNLSIRAREGAEVWTLLAEQEIGEMVQTILLERISKRQFHDVPQNLEKFLEAVQSSPQARIQKEAGRGRPRDTAPQKHLAKSAGQRERFKNRTMEQTADTPKPQIFENIEVFLHSFPQERVHNQMEERIVDILVPQTKEEIAAMIQQVPQERKHARITEQTVDLPMTQVLVQIAKVI